jgi:hypothetical protein
VIDLQRLLSPVDAALCVLALGAFLLVLYLAWARRRLADLKRADEAVERVLTQDEVERILRVAEELAAQGARRREGAAAPGQPAAPPAP